MKRYTRFYEMANVAPVDSGLPYKVWISPQPANRHLPRLKVEFEKGILVPVYISDDPKIPNSVMRKFKISAKKYALVKEWILWNKWYLMMHWNGDMTDKEALIYLLSMNDIVTLRKTVDPENLENFYALCEKNWKEQRVQVIKKEFPYER